LLIRIPHRISATLAASIFLLKLGIHNATSQGYPTRLNHFGADDSPSIGEFVGVYNYRPVPVINLVLISNVPQLLVSVAYYQINAIVSLMSADAEWASFARKKKALRVSSPKGRQRSTYWLQLPYRYSIPLLAIMSTLHWAISQSLFLIRWAVYQDGKEIPKLGISILGWTSGALLLAIILGGVVLIFCVGVGLFKRYPPGPPLLGGCSLVISAACHARPEDQGVELCAVQWGVIGTNEDGTSHCGFASTDVRMPYNGELCS
jgi:hypothetical protein